MNYYELMYKIHTEFGYRRSHIAYARGYQKRTIPPTVEPYKGRYGEGWKVHHPTWTSTQYHIVEYIVKEANPWNTKHTSQHVGTTLLPMTARQKKQHTEP